MGDVVEVSSDSDDTIILEANENVCGNEGSSKESIQKTQYENDREMLQLLSEKYKKPFENNENVEPVINKESKKREKELEKALKGALAASKKNTKPTECIKFVVAIIDYNIINEHYGNDLISALQVKDIKYKTETQIFPRTITWIRQKQSHLINDHGKLILSSTEEDTNHLIIIMNCREFIEHVNNNTLCAHITSIKSVLANKIITLVICDLQSYHKYQKNRKYNEMRTQVTNEKLRKTSNIELFRDFPTVGKDQIAFALTELELFCSCSHRMIESGPELGQMVAQFTKAIAEIPYKQQKQDSYQTEWFVAGDNRDCVNVDKDGNGLRRLWNQALTTFPLASLETAEAISSRYPNVSALMKAYDECQSKEDAELLLQDLPIRRAAGPFSITRRIGTELSKKLYNFFNSMDGEALL
ncbi:crossover junction endonuclease EME1 [Tribolium madens]|uniref:crossover junction endonuclease EME1 n=1 Tax=Tribolium madens TaxID=41895 RepID=UPI001CF75622|nr:crossover junction endonuclease EME1 [Tribolium madens]